MAHIGKFYPLMKERDLFVPGTTNRLRFPKQLILPMSFIAAGHFQPWSLLRFPSEEGVANYVHGTITWNVPGPPSLPGERIVIIHILTFDINFWKIRGEYRSGNTLWWEGESTGALRWFGGDHGEAPFLTRVAGPSGFFPPQPTQIDSKPW